MAAASGGGWLDDRGLRRGRSNLERYAVDLWDGVENLAAANRPNDPRRVSLRFEDVVADPQAELGKLFDFLGLEGGDADPTVFQRLKLPRRMGRPGIDSTHGQRRAARQVAGDDGSWYRKRWCRHYLERLGPHRLALMGYDYDRLVPGVGELDDSTRGIASDIARSAYGLGHQAVTRSLMYPGRRERQSMPRRSSGHWRPSRLTGGPFASSRSRRSPRRADADA